MKTNTIFLIVITFLLMVSCEDDKKQNLDLTQKSLSAKWDVNGTSSYQSFEFNESGNYIITKNDSKKSSETFTIFFGSYQIIDDVTILLSDLGTLKINSIDKNSISFTLTPDNDPGNPVIIDASKVSEYESSSNTELLCRTWKLISINGMSVVGTEGETTVLFSKAGTYLVVHYDGESGLATWKWKDNNESAFCYSWSGDPVCDGVHEVQIDELTISQLTVIESIGESDFTYIFQPDVSSKSVVSNSMRIDPESSSKLNFFRR